MTHDQPPDENWEWETPEQRRPRRLDEETDDVGFPIVWVLIGGLAGLLTIGLIALGVVQLVRKDKPEPTPTILPTLALPATPTVASLMEEELTPTLGPTLIPSPTPLPVIETPTPIPPTPTTILQAPTQLAPDTYAKIVNTGGQGLSMRAGPGLKPPFHSGGVFPVTRQTIMETILCPIARKGVIGCVPCQWGAFHPTPGVCMTCTAMSGSGARTGLGTMLLVQ